GGAGGADSFVLLAPDNGIGNLIFVTERRAGSHLFLRFEIPKSFDSRIADDTFLSEKVELLLVFGVFGCSVF
ncbi:hypothetical protein, partial [Vibrio parahaemolyticus]